MLSWYTQSSNFTLTEGRRAWPAGNGTNAEARNRYPACSWWHLQETEKKVIKTSKNRKKILKAAIFTFFCVDLSL